MLGQKWVSYTNILSIYCPYNHLCFGLILCHNSFSKHTKRILFNKCLHLMLCAQWLCVHVLNAHSLYVQLFRAHWDYWAKTSIYYLWCVCTSVDSFDSSDNTNKNKWRCTFIESYILNLLGLVMVVIAHKCCRLSKTLCAKLKYRDTT